MLLGFLPGKRAVFDQGASQKNDPAGQCSQLGPKVTGFFAVKHGHRPSQGFFAEMDTRLDWPTLTIGSPDGLGGHQTLGWVCLWR